MLMQLHAALLAALQAAGREMPHGQLSLLYTFHFYLFGLIAIVSALLFVTRKSPVAAALWLVNTMFSLAALYVLLDAQFIGAIQVLVYAGAIMVVFLFVIMLLNLGRGDATDVRGLGWKLSAGAVGLALLAQIFALTRARTPINLTLPAGFTAQQIDQTGAIAPIAGPLFNEYLLAFEVTSILLLAAVVGAVVLGKQRGEAEERNAG
jgi:NADH-quinone oxidoreductase subunit J